jgi:hypothetical protein
MICSYIFSYLRKLHTDFHSDWTNLHSHQQCVRVCLFPPHPHQHLLLFVVLMIAILTGLRCNLNVGFDFVSFMAKSVEHFFIDLLSICSSSFKNWLFDLPIYWLDYLFFCLILEFFIYSGYQSLVKWIAKIFSYCEKLSFLFTIVSFAVQKLFNLMQSHLSIPAIIF